MFSILTNFFKSTVRKKLYLHSNLWYIISFVSQVRDHIFLIILNGHRRSSRSWKTFAMRSQGAPSIVKFAKVEGSSSLPLFKRFSWSLENRKWDRPLRFRRLNQNPERLLSLEYIVPGVPSIYQMDAVRHRFRKAEKRCYCLHFRFRYCHAFALFHETHHRYNPQKEGFENLLFLPDAGIHIDEHQVHQATTDHIAIKLLIRFSLSVIPSLLMLIY